MKINKWAGSLRHGKMYEAKWSPHEPPRAASVRPAKSENIGAAKRGWLTTVLRCSTASTSNDPGSIGNLGAGSPLAFWEAGLGSSQERDRGWCLASFQIPSSDNRAQPYRSRRRKLNQLSAWRHIPQYHSITAQPACCSCLPACLPSHARAMSHAPEADAVVRPAHRLLQYHGTAGLYCILHRP